MKKLLSSLFLGSVLAVSLSDCNNGNSPNLSTNNSIKLTNQNNPESLQSHLQQIKTQLLATKQEYLKNNMEPNLNLGDGYDSRTGIGMSNNCLANAADPNAIQLTNPRGTIDFTHTVSSEKVGDFLHATISGDANFALFSASANAEYTRNSSDDRHSVNFNYLQTMSMDATYKIPGIGNKILDPDIRNLLENSGMNDFTNVCGDSVIQSAKMGAVLLVDASFNFASAAARDEFKSEAGADFIFGGASASVHKISESSRKNGTFSIRVFQLGGDPTKLANIFGDGQKSGYHMINCNLTDAGVNECDQVAHSVIAYARNDFQTNVDFNKRSTLYMFDYATKPWSKLAVKAQLPILTDEQRAAREYLTDTITQDRSMLDYLKNYQRQSFYSNVDLLDYSTKKAIEQAVSDYTRVINEYNNYNILDACYGDTESINTHCIYAANQVKEMRIKYESSLNVATLLSKAILLGSPGVGIVAMVPLRLYNIGSANKYPNVFAVFDTQVNSFIDNAICYFDTTADNIFFRVELPAKVGYSLYCPRVGSIMGFYVKRIDDQFNIHGISGRFVDGQNVNFPLRGDGFNAYYGYSSDDKPLQNNPI